MSSSPYMADIIMVGFTFAPRGWAQCDGQIMSINQYQSLFSLLGTTYGGDGRTTFALPDLRGRAPMHAGAGSGLTNRVLGQKFGDQGVSLSANQIPAHTHAVNASTDTADQSTPAGNLPAPTDPPQNTYGAAANLTPGAAGQVQTTFEGRVHNNMQPFNTLTFCIALQGLYPSRN